MNQYLLSFVSVSAFFSNNGMSGSSSNCDSALGFPIDIDTAEAVLTTAVVYSVIHPIVYLFDRTNIISLAPQLFQNRESSSNGKKWIWI